MNTYKNAWFSVLGDSISTLEGYLPKGYPSFYSYKFGMYTGVYRPSDTWWGQVIEHFEGKLLVNNSWSGSYVSKAPMCEVESYGCSDARAYGLDADGVLPDHILIYIGTNDRGAGITMTSEDKDDLSVIENAYRRMLEKIKHKYPAAHIWCCTLPITACSRNPYFEFPQQQDGVPMAAYSELIRRVCTQQGCHVVELEQASDGALCDTLDGLHPNADGMRCLAKRVISAMETAV